MPHAPNNIKEAQPTVRLRTKYGDYKETQEANIFQTNGGSWEDLLDDERWLHKQSPRNTQIFVLSSQPANANPITNSIISRNTCLWDPKLLGNADTIGLRIPTSPHVAFKIAARACASEEGNFGNAAMELKNKLGIISTHYLTAGSNIRGVYVGISAVDCRPLFLLRPSQWNDDVTDTDDLDSFELAIQSDGITGGKGVIWLQNMLIPGNISYLKSALGNKLQGQAKRRFLQVLKREDKLLEDGFNPTGVAKTLPSAELPERKPAICRQIHRGPSYDALHFKMLWPPIAVLEFPQEMIDEMDGFLSNHPLDNVPMTIALAAAIIYNDLAEEGWVSEGFGRDHKSTLDIKIPTIGQFILYFPHMLRFVETKHLTQFIHPARFATHHYSKDGNRVGLKINSAAIDINKLRLWCSQIRSRHPQVPKRYRFSLLPASMPGTQMVFPNDCSDVEPPSTNLFSICCLSDIRTLGLPSYRNRGGQGADFRHIAGPSWLFSKHLDPPTHSMQGYLATDYWKPKSGTFITALTGHARFLDISFPDIPSSYYTDDTIIAQCVKRRFGDVAYYIDNHEYCECNTEAAREERSTRAKELYRVAAYLKIPINKLWQCPNTGCPAWDGMETQLQQLKEQGVLEFITTNDEYVPVKDAPADDEPERAAKRPRLSEPTSTLSALSKERMELLMSSATSLSRDWDAMALYLEGEPTVQEAKRLLSQVQPFILSLEELPCTVSDGGDNYEGDLEAVLRLAYKAVGLDPQLTLTRQKKKWASQFSGFSQFGQAIERAVEDFIALGPLKDGYRYALPSIVIFANSSLVQDQIRIYKEIDALLKEEVEAD
ncbi:hypothetical protein FSST1_000372 [Fusarium sambucinum]